MIWFFGIIAALLLAAGGLYWRWSKQVAEEVAEGASLEWAYFQKSEPDFIAGVSEEKFHEIYAKVHTPRFPGYALAMGATFFVSLPVTFAVLASLSYLGGRLGVFPEPVEIIRAVPIGETTAVQSWQCDSQCWLRIADNFAGFYYFFGVLIVWLLIVAFFMRRFHTRRPGYLRDEIIRARADKNEN